MAKSRRRPGRLPHLAQHAMAPYKRIMEGSGPIKRVDVEVLVRHLLEAFREQDRFNRAQRAQAEDSLPGLHGATHRGGADNIAGTETPSALSATSTGDPGTPQSGFAPIDHDHPAGDLGALAALVDADQTADGYSVEDQQARRLLEEIYVELEELAELLSIQRSRTKWEDLRYPAVLIDPVGLASDPDVDSSDGTLLFDALLTELIYVQVQIPEDHVPGSQIIPHIHWCPTSADTGNVLWRLSYQWAAVGSVYPGTWTDLDLVTPGLGTAERHQRAEWPGIDVPSGEWPMAKVKVARIGGDSLDTYADDARLIEFDFLCQRQW